MRLAVDGTGRLAVVLQTQTDAAAVLLSITLVEVGPGGKAEAGAGAAGAGGISSLSNQSEVIVGSEAGVEPELLRRGLRPLQQAPSEAQLRAAVPAVLWNGEAVRRGSAAGCCRCCCRCRWALLAAQAAPASAARLPPPAHPCPVTAPLC